MIQDYRQKTSVLNFLLFIKTLLKVPPLSPLLLILPKGVHFRLLLVEYYIFIPVSMVKVSPLKAKLIAGSGGIYSWWRFYMLQTTVSPLIFH
jgi:hypothetical protein